MSLNADLNEESQEVIFFRKLNRTSHPKIVFSSLPVVCADWQNHLGIYLDKTLNFNLHIKEKMSKTIKEIGYGDMIYDQLNNENFTQKNEIIQYNGALAITGAYQRNFSK